MNYENFLFGHCMKFLLVVSFLVLSSRNALCFTYIRVFLYIVHELCKNVNLRMKLLVELYWFLKAFVSKVIYYQFVLICTLIGQLQCVLLVIVIFVNIYHFILYT